MRWTILIFLFGSLSAYAESVKLPRGGDISIDSKNWQVHDTSIAMDKSMVFTHRSLKKLTGILLGGTIQISGECPGEKQSLRVCERSENSPGKKSRQLILEKQVEKGSFQRYILTFNFDVKEAPTFDPAIDDLKRSLVRP